MPWTGPTSPARPDLRMARLDLELVARGLARSRSQAQALIGAGEVKVDGEVVRRAAAVVHADGRGRGRAPTPTSPAAATSWPARWTTSS